MWLQASIGERIDNVKLGGSRVESKGQLFFVLLNVLQVVFNAVTAVTVISQGLV